MGIATDLKAVLADSAAKVLLAKACADNRALQGAINFPQGMPSLSLRRQAFAGWLGE
jgi:hypothetical protein